MVTRLQNSSINIANQIRSVFQLSYAVEAELLDVQDFPPLKRSLRSFSTSTNQFFGFLKNKKLVGVVEINQTNDNTSIDSLVVHPKYFRQGIGSQLMEFVCKEFRTQRFIVETGIDNGPAIELYAKFNFEEIERWITLEGIRKVRFERLINN